jgi:prepilin-type N-terminal cleavage/methylation domain-containing protein
MTKMQPRKQRQAAFTLMEVMVALMIFGATMVALATVIHTSVRAWRVGHALNEVGQSVHVTQDVITRDLTNLYYLGEQDYNKSFRRQMRSLSKEIDQQNGTAGQSRRRVNNNGLTTRHAQDRIANVEAKADGGEVGLADVTPPQDLSFHGSGSGGGGELSFARIQPARWEGDPETGGVRRVRYYVKDKTLYREETDPYGFRPGMAFQVDPEDENLSALLTLTQLYMTDEESRSAASATPDLAEAAKQAIPARVNIAEPLCEGVESLELRFGYFRDGKWQTADNWDSGQVQYRHNFDPEEDATRRMSSEERRARQETGADQMKRANQRIPDGLPSYVELKLQVAPVEGKGRTHEFSVFYTIPQAQEDDIYDKLQGEDGSDVMQQAQKLETSLGDTADNATGMQSGGSDTPVVSSSGHARKPSSSRYSHGRSRRNRTSTDLTNVDDTLPVLQPGWGWQSETSY